MKEKVIVFLCMSEHEGFCVPLLEAMMFKLPIIAYDSCAVPETLGNAGIVIDDKDPVFVSYVMHEVAKNSALRMELMQAGAERLKVFERDNVEKRYMDEIKRIIEEIK